MAFFTRNCQGRLPRHPYTVFSLTKHIMFINIAYYIFYIDSRTQLFPLILWFEVQNVALTLRKCALTLKLTSKSSCFRQAYELHQKKKILKWLSSRFFFRILLEFLLNSCNTRVRYRTPHFNSQLLCCNRKGEFLSGNKSQFTGTPKVSAVFAIVPVILIVQVVLPPSLQFLLRSWMCLHFSMKKFKSTHGLLC